MYMLKKILPLFLLLTLFTPVKTGAQEQTTDYQEGSFKAKVVEIIEDNEIPRENGSISIQQKVKLKGLDGEYKNKEIIYDGTQIDMLSAVRYKTGDKVIVNYSPGPDNETVFYISGFSRVSPLLWLILLFILTVIFTAKTRGLRSLIVLALTFLVILKFIIPLILSGHNPLFISIVGSFFILFLAVYLTEGFNRASTVSVASVLIALLITGLLSIWFSSLAKLTGFATETSMYLTNLNGGMEINMKGILLAGIILGALGVLDDVIISQVILVKELKKTDPNLPDKKIYKKGMKVGVSHLSSMVNTLFLAYAGVSLPLLILFSIDQGPMLSIRQIINNEEVTTEIVRALTGSIGLILAVPIATFLAVKFLKNTSLNRKVK